MPDSLQLLALREGVTGSADDVRRQRGRRDLRILSSSDASVVLVGDEVADDVADAATAVLDGGPVGFAPNPPTIAAAARTISELAGGVRVECGPVYAMPSGVGVPTPPGVRVVTSAEQDRGWLRALRPKSWGPDEWPPLVNGDLGPWSMAITDGEVASICHTPGPIGASTAECGTWTAPGHRGRRLAAVTTAAWARLVAAPGRTLFYSTVAENVSSQRVAAHLDLRLLGWRWSLIPGPWPGGDAWGRALEDFDAGVWVPTPELEVSGGEVGPAMHPEWFFRGFDQWDWWDRELLPLVVRGPVLDLGAGAGRAALWLQERGLPVTAVDSSPAAARVCAARGVADVRIGDLNEPPDDQRWRAVLLLCGNLGLGGSWSGCRRLLSRLAQITDPDAVVVADTVEPRAPADIELRIRYKGEVTAWWPQRNIAVDEIAALVDGTGWTAARHLVDVPDHAVLLRRTPTEGGERS